MNSRAEGGIGFFGVLFVLFLFFGMRGCAQNNHQDLLNEFCIEKGYDYGVEAVRHTLITCEFIGNVTNGTRMPRSWDYSRYEEWRDNREVLT